MPFYTVHHATQLSDAQKEALAEAITKIHSTFFTTPRLFVNVIYQNIASAPIYIAGKRRSADLITLQTRTGPSRTHEHYLDLIQQVRDAWEKTVGGPRLDRIIIGGGFVAGIEAGVILPQAGQDKEWVANNWKTFNERAAAGDEEMKDLLADLKSRGIVG